MAKKHRGTPVHSMADEPPVRLEDIVVDDTAAAKAADALRAEIEREYEELGGDGEPVADVKPVADVVTAPKGDAADDLSGEAQDEVVDAIEELREVAEAAAKDAPKECPTCRRPFIAPTLNKEGEETKSSKIRRMAAEGVTKGNIAKALGISYQFVHNVLSRPSKSA